MNVCVEPIKNQVCPRCLGECWIFKGRVGCWFCGGTQDSPGIGQPHTSTHLL